MHMDLYIHSIPVYLLCSCPEHILCSFVEAHLCNRFACLLHFIFLHFLILLVNCLCVFLRFAGMLSYKYCQGFTFTRKSLHARVHLRWNDLLFLFHDLLMFIALCIFLLSYITCQFVHLQWFAFKIYALHLTFRNPASYIKDGHTATFNTPYFLYFFNKYTY
jgi:hypothetical protein